MTGDFIVIKNIKVQNANAISSAVTVGFPAVTAFMGFVHSLQRKLNTFEDFSEIEFTDVGIVCHDFKFHAYKGVGDYDYSIIGTANPLNKDGKRPSFIEEGRCNLTVSIIIKSDGVNVFNNKEVEAKLIEVLNSGIKLAGGEILSHFTQKNPNNYVRRDDMTVYYYQIADEKDNKRLLKDLMPGYFLIERRELIEKSMKEGKDALDSLLDYLALCSSCEKNEEGLVIWKTEKKEKGWLVPIAVGFQGISAIAEPGKTKCQRNPEYCHQFAEAIVTLGEFKMPFRLSSVDDGLWHYEYRKNENLYLCVNEKGE